jgi:uncharacterized protein YhhL (DUF1145 family)
MKLACLVAYALAVAALFGLIHGPVASAAEILSIALLGIHALELFVAFKVLGRYRGPFAVSLLLSLLFGVLHWAPLARQARSEA